MSDVQYLVSAFLPGTDHNWLATNSPTFPLGTPDTPGKLADPVKISRSLPQSDLWPLQPNPATATFSVVTPAAADLEDVFKLGAPVALYVLTPANPFATPVESFFGRIADVQCTIGDFRVKVDDEFETWRALYTVTCADYLVDHAEDQIRWGIDYLGLLASTAATTFCINSALDQMGMGDVVYEEYNGSTNPPSPFVRIPDDTTDLGGLEHIENLLRQWALTGDARGPARYVLDQNIAANAQLDPDQPFVFRLAFKNIDPDADDYTDVPDPAHMAVIDGAQVDLGGSYTLRKYDGIRRVIVYPDPLSGLDRGVSTNPGTPKPTIKLTTSLATGVAESGAVSQARVDALADFYLPADVPRNRWAADTFRWRLHAAPAGSRLPALGSVMSIAPILADWNPTGAAWFTGRLTASTLTVSGGRPVMEFALRDVAS